MIRRDAGASWLLITQADHAAVSARLASHVGGRRFGRVITRRESFLAAVAAHDDGWRDHDAAPAIDGRGRPVDFKDVPWRSSLPIWSASTAAAVTSAGPHAGLLVSLHSLSLSIRPAGTGRDAFDFADPQLVFAVNQFQHREIERQAALRESVGLPTDIPLTHGVADRAQGSAGDDELTYAFRLLQAIDLISLCLCCTRPPVEQTGEVLATPSATPRPLSVARDVHGTLRVRPWPFDVAQLELTVPARRLPARPFADDAALRAAYAGAEVERLTLALRG